MSKDELDSYRHRLTNIEKYLNNQNDIETTEKDLNKLKDDLDNAESLRNNYEAKNKKLEDELLNTFLNVIKEEEYYANLQVLDIKLELEKLRSKIIDSKETMEVTAKCVKELADKGINGDIKVEYQNYVREAELNYYSYMEQEYMLKIYLLVDKQELEYPEIFNKREELNKILQDRALLRQKLKIDELDRLTTLSDLLTEQNVDIQEEKSNIENINRITQTIKFKEDYLTKLEESNNSVEILALLKEFGLIDTYDKEDILPTIEEIPEEVITQDLETPVITYANNQIKSINDMPLTMNFGLAKLKAEAVIKQVGHKLLAPAAKVEKVEPAVETPKTVIPIPVENIVEPKELEIPIQTPAAPVLPPETVFEIEKEEVPPLNTNTPIPETNIAAPEVQNFFWTPKNEVPMMDNQPVANATPTNDLVFPNLDTELEKVVEAPSVPQSTINFPDMFKVAEPPVGELEIPLTITPEQSNRFFK